MEPVSARGGDGGVEDAAQLDAASAPGCRLDGGLLSGQRAARGCGHLRSRAQVSRAHRLAVVFVHGVDAVFFLAIDESGVLHIPGLAAADYFDLRRDGEYRTESRAGGQVDCFNRMADVGTGDVCGGGRGGCGCAWMGPVGFARVALRF